MIDDATVLAGRAAAMQESAIRRMGAPGLRVPELVSFAPGDPAPDVFAWEDVARLGFSAQSHARIDEGIRRLAAAGGEERSATKSVGAPAAVSAGSEP